jgi:hypothetical protein
MSAADVFNSYLDRFTSGDIDGAAALLADEFSFRGPMLQSEGKVAFLEGASGLIPITRGYDMHEQWVDGDEVCSVYDFNVETPAGAGSVKMAEWCTVRDGVLVSSRLMFDPSQFQAFMPSE